MTPAATSERTAVPWKRGVAWLLVLGPFFFASYGFATWTSAQREAVAVLAYAWERSIPFLPWTIVPYWSIDLIYGLSFLACRDEREVDRHGLRLLTVQVVAIACFLAWPMRFSFARPATDGVAGALYAALESFDQPFNQAPSLHSAILVVVWARVAPSCRRTTSARLRTTGSWWACSCSGGGEASSPQRDTENSLSDPLCPSVVNPSAATSAARGDARRGPRRGGRPGSASAPRAGWRGTRPLRRRWLPSRR